MNSLHSVVGFTVFSDKSKPSSEVIFSSSQVVSLAVQYF